MAEEEISDLTNGGKLPWFRRERRVALSYKEALSNRMVRLAGLVAVYIIVDPQIAVPLGDGSFLKFGGTGFSSELKGVVIGIVLSEGYKKISEYWFGNTAAGQKTGETMERMAEAAPVAATKAAEKALDVVASLPPAPAEPLVTPAPATAEGIIPAKEVAKP